MPTGRSAPTSGLPSNFATTCSVSSEIRPSRANRRATISSPVSELSCSRWRLPRADAADPAAAELLRNGIGTQLTDTEVDTLRQVITDLGAVTDVETQIDTLVEAAANALDSSTATAESKARLTDMAIAATKRSY